jgi:hypothetical protein
MHLLHGLDAGPLQSHYVVRDHLATSTKVIASSSCYRAEGRIIWILGQAARGTFVVLILDALTAAHGSSHTAQATDCGGSVIGSDAAGQPLGARFTAVSSSSTVI